MHRGCPPYMLVFDGLRGSSADLQQLNRFGQHQLGIDTLRHNKSDLATVGISLDQTLHDTLTAFADPEIAEIAEHNRDSAGKHLGHALAHIRENAALECSVKYRPMAMAPSMVA